MQRVGWKLWYGDGTTADSVGSEWEDAPDDNVQFLTIFHRCADGRVRRAFVHGMDEEPALYRLPGQTDVKRGRWMDDEGYNKLFASAVNDTWRPNTSS